MYYTESASLSRRLRARARRAARAAALSAGSPGRPRRRARAGGSDSGGGAARAVSSPPPQVDGDAGTAASRAFAAEALGDVVFVDLPDVGSAFDKGESFGSVESVKAASDVSSPVRSRGFSRI